MAKLELSKKDLEKIEELKKEKEEKKKPKLQLELPSGKQKKKKQKKEKIKKAKKKKEKKKTKKPKQKKIICNGINRCGAFGQKVNCPHAVPHKRIKKICKIQVCSKLGSVNNKVHCEEI